MQGNFLIENSRLAKKSPIAYKRCLNLDLNRLYFMRVRASIKADPAKGDKIVRRRGRIYVINKTDPNRKQRQKGPARKKK